MGRTEVTRGQFSRFCEETGYVTDAEKPNGWTQVFNHDWDRYNYTVKSSIHGRNATTRAGVIPTLASR